MKRLLIIQIVTVAVACLADEESRLVTINIDYVPETETMRRILAAEKDNDRSELPFLEETALHGENLPGYFPDRSRAAEVYAQIATAEECAAFLPKILAIDDENKKFSGWRDYATPVLMGKIQAAADSRELREETLTNLVTSLVAYTQTAYSASEARLIDEFLIRHCEGYGASCQRLAMWVNILDADKENEVKWERFSPFRQSVEAIPPKERVDLRKRFPGTPPLPEGMAAEAGKKPAPILYIALALLLLALAALALLKLKKGRAP